MELYKKNLETLKKYYPDMDVLIESAENVVDEELEVKEEISKDAHKILKVKRNDRICYLNGKRNSREPAALWVESLGKLETNSPVLIMGAGNEAYLEELVKGTKKRITIVVYEPSLKIFKKFLDMIDLAPLMEKQLIIFWIDGLNGMDEKNLRVVLSGLIKYEMLCYSRKIILPNYDLLFPEQAINFLKLCREIMYEEVAGYNTKNIFSNVMVKNLLSNSRFLCDGYKTTQLVEVIPRDIPGILVAAGPSLNKNIKELKKAKGKAFIIAVDTAIKPLLKEGIIPDMYAIVDAMKPLDLVRLEEARDIPLVTTLNAASEVLEYHTGKKFFYNEGYQFAERIFRKTGQKIGNVNSGGSVATSAFSLLYKIGIDTIILVGQDLAYTNNKSHADGTFQETMNEEDTSHFMMVEGNYEEKVPTRPDFKIFLDWYGRYIEGCKEHRERFRVINATEGGARIKGTEVMSLEDAIARECTKEVDIEKCLDRLQPMLDQEARRWSVDYLHGLAEEYRSLGKEAAKIKRNYQKLDKICSRRNIDTKEYLSVLKGLEKQIGEIEGKSTYQLISITLSNAQYILRNEQFLQEKTMQAEGKEIARKGILYMQNVEKGAKAIGEYAQSIFGEWESTEENS